MTLKQKVAQLAWAELTEHLDTQGFAVTQPVLTKTLCRELEAMYDDPSISFRSTVNMASHNFGRGEYKYFDYPLPDEVQILRECFYTFLAPIANLWAENLRLSANWPDTLAELTSRCHAAGQTRSTTLMLRYKADDFNCLHQDLYGPIHFPFQVVILLNVPGEDFSGGEFVLVEQRPRMQSRPMVIPFTQGSAVIIPVRERPRPGSRGYHRTQLRHGVSVLHEGRRSTLGLIFHDAA